MYPRTKSTTNRAYPLKDPRFFANIYMHLAHSQCTMTAHTWCAPVGDSNISKAHPSHAYAAQHTAAQVILPILSATKFLRTGSDFSLFSARCCEIVWLLASVCAPDLWLMPERRRELK